MLADAYGCAVTNRFGELLDDEADPFDLISEVETEKEKEKKKKKKKEEEKKNTEKKPGQRESQRERRVPKAVETQEGTPGGKLEPSCVEGGATRGDAQRGMKRSAAGQRMDKQEACPQDDHAHTVDRPLHQSEWDPRGRGGFREKRRGQWTKNPENANMRDRRDYDRQNRTGLSPEEKRGGRGPWNWGCVEDAAKEAMDVTSHNHVNKSTEPQNPVEDDLNDLKRGGGEEEEELVVQVAMEMSLDEWKALQENSRSKAALNLRKAEDKIPTRAKVIHQSKRLENLKISSEELEEDAHFLRRSVNDITSLLDINFGSLGRPSRGRGRGGARGGQSGRTEKPKALIMERVGYAPNPDDPEHFPALPGGK